MTIQQEGKQSWLTVDEVTLLVVFNMDDNHDGHITECELMLENVFRRDKNFDLQVSHDEFVNFWTKTYHDDHTTTVAFFHNLDFNHDNVLTTYDITHHLATLDQNGDSMVTDAEFRHIMHLIHPEGTKHGR